MDIDLNLTLGNTTISEPENKAVNPTNSSTSDEEETSTGIRRKIEQMLEVGSVFESLDDVYVLYCKYARLSGFSIKKGTQGYLMNSLDLRMKVYYCSCEGFADGKCYKKEIPTYRKQIRRTNYKARLRVTRDVVGPWSVSVFYTKHNHDLVPPTEAYLLRSARNMSHAKKSVIQALKDAGIGVSTAFRFLEHEARGVQNIGFTKQDAWDEVKKTRRKSNLPESDSLMLMEFLKNKQAAEPYFYWDVERDDNQRLMSFFFRDTGSATDYDYFGDVMSVDATYRTNKYELFCIPFVGINHHRSNVLFGVGFLNSENEDSYNWLMKTFLASMNNKEPEVIFTDQCKALMNAVDNHFHSASHRLCQWHINRNATKQFASLKLDSTFRKLWQHCMNGCETQDDFDATWELMMDKYSLSDVGWFKTMFSLRTRWAAVFTNNKFSVGLHATSRSEATNRVLKEMYMSSALLSEFVMNYERIQNSWRTAEAAEDALCIGRPGQFVESNKLLTYAANVYMLN